MQLKYLVIHCTATPEGREVSADEIRRWHTAPKAEGGRGWKQVGYTDMIHLDGKVQRRSPPHRLRGRRGCRRHTEGHTHGGTA